VEDRIFNFRKSLTCFCDTISYALILIFIFLLPIKFTVPAMLPNSGVFPLSLNEWIFEPWSTSLFPVISSILLVFIYLRLFVTKSNFQGNLIPVPLLWLLLGGFSFLGFIHASCFDFPVLECTYIFGIASFALLVFLFIFHDANNQTKLINTLVICSLILCLYGLYQYFFGFDDTRTYVANFLKSNPSILSKAMINRLKQNQIFSTFAISNNFAGYLILIIPLTIFSLLKSKSNSSIMLKYLIIILLTLIMILSLLLTGSRSAILSLLITIVLFMLLILKLRKIFIGAFILAAAVFISGIFFAFSKGLPSIIVRFDYFYTSFILLKNHIFAGSGWGSFSFAYPYMKKYMTGESPVDPHNFLLSIGSQAGILAMFITLTIFLIPIFFALKSIAALSIREKLSSIEFPLLLGYCAWLIHSLTDTNFQIPGSVTIAIIFSAIMIKESSCKYYFPLKYYKLLLLLMVISSCLAIFGLGSNRLIGEYYYARLNSACINNPLFDSDSQKADPEEVNLLLAKAQRYMPYSPFPLATVAHYEADNNNLLLAEQYMEKAVSLAPEKASYYHDLAVILIKEGKKLQALYCIKKAYELFPYKYKYAYKKIRKYTINE